MFWGKFDAKRDQARSEHGVSDANIIKRRRCIGFHIPKCAGTSLATFVRKELMDGEYYIFASFRQNRLSGRPELFENRVMDRLKFVFGHRMSQEMARVLWTNSSILFTGLRNPEERMISDYRHYLNIANRYGTAKPEPQNFVEGQSNAICRSLIENFPTAAALGGGNRDFEKALSVLSLFNHIYETANFEESIHPVIRALGIQNDIEQKDNVSTNATRDDAKELQEILGDQIEEDKLLYDFVQTNSTTDEQGFRTLNRNEWTVELNEAFRAMPDPTECFAIMRDQLMSAIINEAEIIGKTDELRDEMLARRELADLMLSQVGH